ncbi:MAG: hypothetical protein IJE29_07545, partial [Firmicutes bacterium]|nr:hypothetical protein [Bacillota bacterium]
YPSCFITRDESTKLFDNHALEEIITAEEWQQLLITDGVYNKDRRDAFFAAHPLIHSTDA